MAEMQQLWRLEQYPDDVVTKEHLVLQSEAVPELQDGDVKIKVIYASVDPANRLWIRAEGSYLPPFPLGVVMPAACIGVIAESRHPRYSVGQKVQGICGWQEYAVINGGPGDTQLPLGEGGILHLPEPPEGTQLLDFFGLFGVHGMTAYFGLVDIGKAKKGDTVLISAAAGAVGSVTTQIAKNLGCRVIGLAGGSEKCKKVVEEFGADACIDYKNDDIQESLKELAPDGVDVYFDNVGGDILEAAIDNMARYGRIVFCGAISQYNDQQPRGPANYMTLLYKEIELKGFLVFSYMPRMEEAITQLGQWMMEGKLHMNLDVHQGIENSLDVFNSLFDGSNKGKLVVQIGDLDT